LPGKTTMHVSHETSAQVEKRLLRVIARAELRVLEGTYAFTEYPVARLPLERASDALAFVRDQDVWSVLGPATGRAVEPLRVFLFHFPPEVDNSGFVGWLASHLKTALGTGVLVVCGFNQRRGGVFDYWCLPERVGEAALAEVRRIRGEVY